MNKSDVVTMEIARALMDLYQGLELVDALSMARYRDITLG